MSDDPKKKEDLTRIEDLSEYLHEEDENDDFLGLNTDPDLTLPDDFNSTDEADYSALEEDLDNIEPDSISDNFDDSEELSDDEPVSDFETDFSDKDFENEVSETSTFDDSPLDETSFDSESDDDDSFSDQFESDEIVSDEVDSTDFSQNEDDDDNFLEEQSEFDDIETSLEDLTTEEIQENENQTGKFDEAPAAKTTLTPLPATDYKAPENFQDLQKFAKNMSYGNLSHEGNPPFSIVLKDIKYQEDLDDIVILLKEFKILKQEDETSARETLSRGSFLIPRLSEYAAILLCHKLRRYELTILMGLTEEINPAKSYSSDDSGMATKHNIFNSRSHSFIFENENISFNDIISSTAQNLEGYDIKEYLGVVSDHSIVTSEELTNDDPGISDHLYDDLVSKLKYAAVDKKGNGVVGINYTMVPLLKESATDKNQYKIICTGNVVWLIKK